MTEELKRLIEQARNHVMTNEEKIQQAISFVYGNLPEESKTTREQVERTVREQYGLENREHVATDGTVRKSYYQTDAKGRQPWDVILDASWAPEFAAGNVLKYLRRAKGSDADDVVKALWYFTELEKLVKVDRGELKAPGETGRAYEVYHALLTELTPAECGQLGVTDLHRPGV